MASLEYGAPVGVDTLIQVNDAMVELHERYHGRTPGSSRTQMLGPDMLACMLGDMYTDVEKTMIELQHEGVVQETRSVFQRATEHRFIGAVERITGRQVTRFISTHHVGPDLEVELFELAP